MAWLACAALTGCTVLGLVELVSFLAVFRVRPPAGIVLLLATTAGLSALVGYEAVTLRRFVRSREHAHLLAALRAQKVCWAFLGLLGAVGLVLALVALLGGA